MVRIIENWIEVLFLCNIVGIHMKTSSGNTLVENVSIECKSERYGVVFKFHAQKSTDNVRIAECQFGPGAHSQLMNDSFRNEYNVTYRDKTCILTVLRVKIEKCGAYTCSEMYNETETVQKQIELTCQDVTTEKECKESHATLRTWVIVMAVVCAILLGIMVYMGFNMWRKKSDDTTNAKRVRKLSEDETLTFSPPSINPEDERLISSSPSINPEDERLTSSSLSINPEDERLTASPPAINPEDERLTSSPLAINPEDERLTSSPLAINQEDERLTSSPPAINQEDNRLTSSPPPINRTNHELDRKWKDMVYELEQKQRNQ
ncbi:uncharacterized protein LOC127870289 [Dreissena polymorpha]|uniref:Uncharacterized protein n=1 Tax=Dreissena polymorpha TaxID=45954 RepID=A0A9D4LWM1_DREPO|nr:uncharacterized protein LOC127870289 [Dreissena polymorpha]KAH3866465.1 hypothetical protein DPMN_029529 [Dreissena polymorpha]